jgi:hypothetical protein
MSHPPGDQNPPADEVLRRPIGFIGLGSIGAPMARHLLGWPAGLVVADIREAATAPFASDGAVVASDNTELAASCGIVSVMVLTTRRSAASPTRSCAVHGRAASWPSTPPSARRPSTPWANVRRRWACT